MDEIDDLTPIYGGITHDCLETEGSIQRPYWNEEHPGTPNLYQEEFNTDDGKAHMFPTGTSMPADSEMDEQYEALVMATERGYYRIPSAIDSETLAAELDITPQALLERFRCGQETLNKNAVGIDIEIDDHHAG